MARNWLLYSIYLIVALTTGVSGIPTSARIVGGQDAKIGQFPYQVSLQYENSFPNCGGSILNERFIITAAHCVVVGNGIETYPVKFYQVRVGSVLHMMGGQLLKFKRIIVHKSYIGPDIDFLYDVALLELERPLQWSEYVQPIEMAFEEVPPGAAVIVSGWGRLSTSGRFPSRLQWNTVEAISVNECKEEIVYAHESILCLRHKIQNGACFGDSGGPATYNGKLVGVFSFVVGYQYPECGTEHPDGYIKISHLRDWILENMKS